MNKALRIALAVVFVVAIGYFLSLLAAEILGLNASGPDQSLLRSGDFHKPTPFEKMSVDETQVMVDEGYGGPAWSPDSKKAYFVRHVLIYAPRKPQEENGKAAKALNAKLERLAKKRNPEEAAKSLGPRDLLTLFSSIGTPPDIHLYENLTVYSYDLSNKRLETLAEIKERPDLKSFFPFFNPVVTDNKIVFEVAGITSAYQSYKYSIDATTGKVSLSRNDALTGRYGDEQQSGVRYHFSPDKHSYIEMSDYRDIKDSGSAVVRIFHDPEALLITEPDISEAVKNVPQVNLSPELFHTAEERSLRKKHNIPLKDKPYQPFKWRPSPAPSLPASFPLTPEQSSLPALPVDPQDLQIPRVMFWWGKVNQHWNLSKAAWETDSDGLSGAMENKLDYCKKFYPATSKVVRYKTETINSWRDAYNVGQYGAAVFSYRCVQEGENVEGDDVSDLTETPESAFSAL